MKISNLAMNLRGPWMISPEDAAAMAPILKGVLSGLITEFDKAPEPYLIKCDSFMPAPAGAANPYLDKSVYVTYLKGTMMKYDDCEAYGTKTIAKNLLSADKNPEVIGHIIVADSGGGSSASVPAMASAIRSCQKPVIGFVDGTAASACLYALSYCDTILASNEMDMVGCVGTMITLSGLSKYHKGTDGTISVRIYADSAADKNADYEQALEGDFRMIKETLLNPANAKFIQDMKTNRPGATDDQLTGMTYYAKDVIGSLIDGICSFEDALQTLVNMATPVNSTSTNMAQPNNNYPTLLAIPAFEGQVFDQEGATTLQPNQLEAVEASLAEASGLQATIDGLNGQLADAQQTIAARDARISELENSLAAAIQRAENPSPETPNVDHTPEGASQIRPAETFEDALKACQDFLRN